MDKIKFEEMHFRAWLDTHVGFSIRKAEGKTSNPDYDRANEDVLEAIGDLTSMELVCYLGEYLTTEQTQ